MTRIRRYTNAHDGFSKMTLTIGISLANYFFKHLPIQSNSSQFYALAIAVDRHTLFCALASTARQSTSKSNTSANLSLKRTQVLAQPGSVGGSSYRFSVLFDLPIIVFMYSYAWLLPIFNKLLQAFRCSELHLLLQAT